jgi:hypothetical protein
MFSFLGLGISGVSTGAGTQVREGANGTEAHVNESVDS